MIKSILNFFSSSKETVGTVEKMFFEDVPNILVHSPEDDKLIGVVIKEWRYDMNGQKFFELLTQLFCGQQKFELELTPEGKILVNGLTIFLTQPGRLVGSDPFYGICLDNEIETKRYIFFPDTTELEFLEVTIKGENEISLTCSQEVSIKFTEPIRPGSIRCKKFFLDFSYYVDYENRVERNPIFENAILNFQKSMPQICTTDDARNLFELIKRFFKVKNAKINFFSEPYKCYMRIEFEENDCISLHKYFDDEISYAVNLDRKNESFESNEGRYYADSRGMSCDKFKNDNTESFFEFVDKVKKFLDERRAELEKI